MFLQYIVQDINVYNSSYFNSLIQDNVVWILLVFFLPNFAVIYEPSSDLENGRRSIPFHFVFKKLNLKRTGNHQTATLIIVSVDGC
jgi:hypothetical protein